ncbi:MAG: efflux RND transporter permease subunit [Leptospiraceae bacterium]|nr:efflux RND transporter permease subunit [Leptospiraceae bacterium]
MRSLISYFLDKSIFLNLLTALILIIGAYKSATINREAFPNINFDIVTVTTIYPGATAAEVEKLITKPIEDSIKSVDGIKETRSGSIENRSGIVITIDPNTKDTQKVVDDIKSAVEKVEDLPEDSKKPIVTELTSGRTPVIEVNIGIKPNPGGKQISEIEFQDKVKILEDLLMDIPEVGRISKRGYRDREMHVDLKPDAMDSLNVSPMQVIMSLRMKNINFPGGNITNNGREAAIRTIGEFDTPEEIEEVYIRSNDAGRSVKMKDIADVEEDFVDKEYIEKTNSLYAIGLVVIKKEKSDAINLVSQVKEVVQKFEAQNNDSLTFSYVNDISKYIRRRLDVLISNGFQGFLLVVISLFFFLGWRVSLMVSLGLPLATAMTLLTLDYLGITLNLISMMGLIIVIGMIVDDAIVISENIYRYLEAGEDVYEACVKGTVEVIAPVTATITTTCAAFGPMLFMSGIFGKFIYSIPLVVIIALLSSLVESIFILPSHIMDINRGVVHSQKSATRTKFLAPIQSYREKHPHSFLSVLFQYTLLGEKDWYVFLRDLFYKPSLSFALRHKYLTVLLFSLAFWASIAAAVVFGRFKLFPGGVEIFIVRITAPVGLTLESTERFARVIEDELAKLPKTEIENYVTRIGITQKDPNDPFTKRGKNFGMVMVYMTPDSERKRSVDEIMNSLRDRTSWMLSEEALKVLNEKKTKMVANQKNMVEDRISESPSESIDIPPEYMDLKGKLTVLDYEKIQGGPPVGKPVAIEIRGDDFSTLMQIADEFKTVMREVPGVTDIGDDYYEGKDEIRIKIDEKLASQAGVSVQLIAQAINTAYQGAVATKIKRADQEVDVRVRFPMNYRASLKSLDKIFVNNNMGNMIPISRMVTYVQKPGIASINHLDAKRLITVSANLDDLVTDPRKANLAIKKASGNLIDKYPGYRVRYGGENKDTEESLASLGRAFLVAFLIIFIILASLFSSLLQPIMVVSAIPFSFMGVAVAFITHGHYFSFLSFIGIVGLAGIVVNDSIVLVDFANNSFKKDPNRNSYDVLLETGLVRLRPVLLTTITTVLGILPTAYGIGGSDPFLKPMALAIGWGLMFATSLTLILIPVLYKITYDAKKSFVDRFLPSKKEISVENPVLPNPS